MSDEPLSERLKRQRRNEGKNWSEKDELAWQEKHSGDALPDWMKPTPALVNFEDDLVPQLEHLDLPPETEADAAVNAVGIIEAYARWCGKMVPKVGNKRESIMISCPVPTHRDKVPSAWISLNNETWYCGACGKGGDKYDIAAYHFGFDNYKGKDFPKLREKMAEDLGFATVRNLSGKPVPVLNEQSPEPAPIISAPVSALEESFAPNEELGPELEESRDNIIEFPGAFDHEAELTPEFVKSATFIDWESLCPDNTFMMEWMDSTTIDDLPQEYYFWLGMQALGAAAGSDVILEDYKPVKPNLYLCLYGKTGSGKSRALDPFMKLIKQALPYEEDPLTASTGTKILPSPGSAEALLHSFKQEMMNPSTMKPDGLAPVRGLLKVEEFAAFVSRASRQSSTMKEMLIELYDVYDNPVTHYALSQGPKLEVPNPFCQMVTTTQPKAIHSFMHRSDADSGFMNRWVFATGTRRKERISHGGVRMDISGSVDMLKTIRAWASTGHEMRLENDALKAWDQFYQANLSEMLDTTDEGMISRIDLTLKKLIILFTVNERLSHPTAEIVERACQLFPYLHATCRMFSVDINHSELNECQTQIIELIEKSPRGIVPGTISRSLKKFPIEMIERSLRTLEALEMITLQAVKTPSGQVAKRYVAG